ncbi:PLD nuclease N-terminal domain-containing protein [Streptomyces kronopolitis]|uniref:PLD nuclease N-terminal domain-containing protein n=1 Tax=Streptomyces kronopolitis TaxID=1612435 RepID=UPI003698DBB6
MLRYLPLLLVLALWIYAFIDCLNTPESQVRGLPKVAWVLIILLFGEVLVGPVAWLVAGKQRRPGAAGGATPWRRDRGTTWVAPDDNPEFLRSLKDQQTREDSRQDGTRIEDGKDGDADLRRREEELRRKKRDTADGPEETS